MWRACVTHWSPIKTKRIQQYFVIDIIQLSFKLRREQRPHKDQILSNEIIQCSEIQYKYFHWTMKSIYFVIFAILFVILSIAEQQGEFLIVFFKQKFNKYWQFKRAQEKITKNTIYRISRFNSIWHTPYTLMVTLCGGNNPTYGNNNSLEWYRISFSKHLGRAPNN